MKCNGDCFNCPFPDVPDECLERPLDESEKEIAVEIDLQSLKYGEMEPEEKSEKAGMIRREWAKTGRVQGVDKRRKRETHYPEYMYAQIKYYSRIGQMIRDARKKRGWTLKETADKMGISVSTLSYWQDGRSRADWEKVCAVFQELKSKTKKYQEILDEYRKSAIDCEDLKAKRLGARLSQRQMAKLINTSVATYQLWESGKCKPNIKNQKKLKEALKNWNHTKRSGDNPKKRNGTG